MYFISYWIFDFTCYRLSASCVHVSALLHALVSLKPSSKIHDQALSDDSEDDVLKKRKASALRISDATFEKHEYGKERKYPLQDIQHYDPRPTDLRGNATNQLPELLERVKGKGLCVSLLFDPAARVNETVTAPLSKADMIKES